MHVYLRWAGTQCTSFENRLLGKYWKISIQVIQYYKMQCEQVLVSDGSWLYSLSLSNWLLSKWDKARGLNMSMSEKERKAVLACGKLIHYVIQSTQSRLATCEWGPKCEYIEQYRSDDYGWKSILSNRKFFPNTAQARMFESRRGGPIILSPVKAAAGSRKQKFKIKSTNAVVLSIDIFSLNLFWYRKVVIYCMPYWNSWNFLFGNVICYILENIIYFLIEADKLGV